MFSQSQPLSIDEVRYWAYQIQGLDLPDAIGKIVNSRYDMVVIDPTVTCDYEFDAKDMVNRIKSSKASDGIHRKLVVAYIDIGEAEEWRWYWEGHSTYEEYGECRNSFINEIQSWAPFVVACDPDGWAGNYPVAFWDNDWKDIVIEGTSLGSHLDLYFSSMLDEVIQDGFDGVYLDWVEAWEMTEVQNKAHNEGKNPGQEMLKFIKEIRSYGKQFNPNFIVIQQNSSELINEVGAAAIKNAVDAITQEGVWWDGVGGNDDWNDPEGYDYPSCCTNYYLPRLQSYQNANLPVFVCEYAVQNADEVYENAKTYGFIAYATRRSLSKLSTTPPEFIDIEAPIISTNVNHLNFAAIEYKNNPESRKIQVWNSGPGNLNWSASENANWLSVHPISGYNSSIITVSVNISNLEANSYTSNIIISDSNASNSPQTIPVALRVFYEGEDDFPFGSFDSPSDHSTVRGSVAVTGWALDDIAVESIKIYHRNNDNEGFIYIGQAVPVEGARPDVEQTYSNYPMNHKAGWGYMLLSNFLPNNGNGTFTLLAVVTDFSGNQTTIGEKTIICDNKNAQKPFGAIDTPTQGGIASGYQYVVWGWALTPQPNQIPIDGTTINVYVDGINIGIPTFNIYRSDIAHLFPGYANSNGAAGYFYLDTTAYENGIHTIQWVVTDNNGNVDGIGSRYFSIEN